METSGREGFSVRKVAREVQCDVMAVLYHFENRDGLERAMADAVVATLREANSTARFRSLANREVNSTVRFKSLANRALCG